VIFTSSAVSGFGRPTKGRAPIGRSHATATGERGQALVEFSLVVVPFLFIVLAIIQFAFVFQAWITLNSAVRDASREVSLYVYDTNSTPAANDLVRNNQLRTQLLGRFNGLTAAAPQFTSGTTWTTATVGTTITATNGDLTIVYELPTTTEDNDPRQGWRMTVRATYHQELVVPIVSNLIPKDAGGRLQIPAEVSVVIN
jgi:Flp pilus assembly protein TadG